MSKSSEALRQRSAEEILRRVAAATAAVTGEELFQALARSLATALGRRCCLLTECLDDPPTRLSTLAFWHGEGFADNCEYDLAGTPCERVVAGEACVYHRGLQEQFPRPDLVDLGAESYAGVPFRDAVGTVRGHLAVLDVDAIAEGSLDLSILEIFAARAGGELDRRRAIAELREQRRTLERRVEERTRNLEDFAHTLSHDLRSPLVTVGGFASLLATDFGEQLDAKGQRYLAHISEASRRMGAIIDQVLAYSRLRHVDVERQPVAVADAVAEAVERLSAEIAAAGAGIEEGDTALAVLAHRPTLIEVLVRLISNAIEYGAADLAPEVRIDAQATAAGVRIRVRDNGIGIAAEDHERIFEAFERITDAHGRQGTGLGLAIVHKAMDKMGGRVGVESAVGSGSTFWIELEKASVLTPA